MSKARQPEWIVPKVETETPTLKIWNSLTRTKVPFIPKKARQVTWYNCGPTVYDHSHVGHARNYLTQDIIRRILRDYFGYNVNFVMNVTDVDDKIILKARHEKLLKNYTAENITITPKVLKDVEIAINQYARKNFEKVLQQPIPEGGEDAALENVKLLLQNDWAATIAREEKSGLYVEAVMNAKRALTKASLEASPAELFKESRDILAFYLDRLDDGQSAFQEIFRPVAAYWERDYFNDMSRLGIEPPDVLTRVSEYIPEIVEFVKKIVEKGYAYEAMGNIYFDLKAFDGAKPSDKEWLHSYGKLKPEARGDRVLMNEGEGSLSTSLGQRAPSDFALWKASKKGEPSWDSPWGPGRPGWHIECSVMASAVLGESIDIHSGGIDLCFPHHDNEIAQSEAYHDCRQWINYFIHTGHLHIKGQKMSKSLKNFITIDQALEANSSRQLRLLFILQPWKEPMDLVDSALEEVTSKELAINNFFSATKALIREKRGSGEKDDSDGHHHYGPAESDLAHLLETSQIKFREALSDSFDTKGAFRCLMDLLASTRTYMQRGRDSVNVGVLEQNALWITRMLSMFGLSEDPSSVRTIGWGEPTDVQTMLNQTSREEIILPFLEAVSAFRDKVRAMSKENASSSEILDLCDRLRDEQLVELGVQLDDQEDGKALYKFVPKEQLRRVREEKMAVAERKKIQLAANKLALQEKANAKLAKAAILPQDLFRSSEFGSWNEDGFPLTSANGEPLSKSREKSLKKDLAAHSKLRSELNMVD